MMRRQIQADLLKNPEKARELLLGGFADRTTVPHPWCNWPASRSTGTAWTTPRPSSPRSADRWKESATADVLDAQIALKRGKIPDAASTSTRL